MDPTFLARQGWKVVLLEKDVHPRFHIGESLLPMNLPILQRLGVLDQVAAIGVHKPGADFPMRGDRDSVNVFRFDRALHPQFGHAYQVRRSEFDQLLFDNALASGVVPLTFALVRGRPRPKVRITHTATDQVWTF